MIQAQVSRVYFLTTKPPVLGHQSDVMKKQHKLVGGSAITWGLISIFLAGIAILENAITPGIALAVIGLVSVVVGMSIGRIE